MPAPPPSTVTAFAQRLVLGDRLEDKLASLPAELTDSERGPAERIAAPGRPACLQIVAGRDARVPPPEGMRDPSQRARILHALANHELQAAELFAWALLAFPEAPDAFRRGCLGILVDEQRHLALYLERLTALGGAFGEHPVSGHFWKQIQSVRTPLQFVCVMGLTFENANLDFAAEHIVEAESAGDPDTADVLRAVHADEVRHVAFGWQWLESWRDGADAWDVYTDALGERLGPERARGRNFDRAAREAAGLDAAFVQRLENTRPRGPGGASR